MERNKTMKHNKALFIAGLTIMFASLGLIVFNSEGLLRLLFVPAICFGYGVMALAADPRAGSPHLTLGSYASKNLAFLIGISFGTLFGILVNPDITMEGAVLRLLSIALGALAWAAPYFASRYPAGKPLLRYKSAE